MRRAPSLAVALALALVGAACRTAAPGLAAAPPAGASGPPPRVALVLGGGGARGFAHVGVIRVLEEAGVPVSLVVGTSVGSLVGALYASDPSAAALERGTQGLGLDDFFDFSLGPFFGKGLGLAAGERLEGFVRGRVAGARIEQLRIPYAAVATDLGTGEAVVLREGDVASAVRASCAIPGVFEPVEREGRLLVDGSVASTLPVRIARELGADVVIAVDVSAIAGETRPRSFVEVFLRAVDLAAHAEVAQARREADVLLAPDVGAVGFLEFDRKGDARAAGADAARAALPRIREVVEGWRADRGR
jgi:NTE family protein